MKKKDFTSGFDALLTSSSRRDIPTDTSFDLKEEQSEGPHTVQIEGEPEKNDTTTPREAFAGPKRTTLMLDAILLQKIKSMALWTHSTMKDVMHEALQSHVNSYEKQHGPIPIPKD
jgi:hypothetical protein